MANSSTPNPAPANGEAERLRIRTASSLTIFGLSLAAALAVLFVFKSWSPTGIATVVGLFTSVLGTIIGAFFGLQIGSAGKAQADADKAKAEERANRVEEQASRAQRKVEALLHAADQATIDRARGLYPNAFQ